MNKPFRLFSKFSILLVFYFLFFTQFVFAAEMHLVSNPTEFQQALDESASNGVDDFIFVAPGTYNITSTLTYSPESSEEYGLAIGGFTIYDRPVLNGGMTAQIMNIRYHCDADWNNYGASVLIADMAFELGKGVHGGLSVHRKNEKVHIINNKFTANQSTDNDSGIGAVCVVTNRGPIHFVQNTVSNNTGGVVGGVGLNTWGGEVIAHNNTIVHNHGNEVGGFYLGWQTHEEINTYAQSYIFNNIIWDNQSWEGPSDERDLYTYIRVIGDDDPRLLISNNALGVDSSSGLVKWEISEHGDSYNPIEVRDNLHGDPFVRLDYYLDSISPCIDYGDNPLSGSYHFPPYDYFYVPRILDGNSDGIAVVDIGASEYGQLPGQGEYKQLYRYVPGNPDSQMNNEGPIKYLSMKEWIKNLNEEVGWRVSIKRTSRKNAYYSLHYADNKEQQYATGETANKGTITIPQVDVPKNTKFALEFMLYMDTRKEEEKDRLSVCIDDQEIWNKDEENVKMGQWQKVKLDLSQFNGQKIDIDITFDTISAVSDKKEGVYIDQIIIGPGITDQIEEKKTPY